MGATRPTLGRVGLRSPRQITTRTLIQSIDAAVATCAFQAQWLKRRMLEHTMDESMRSPEYVSTRMARRSINICTRLALYFKPIQSLTCMFTSLRMDYSYRLKTQRGLHRFVHSPWVASVNRTRRIMHPRHHPYHRPLTLGPTSPLNPLIHLSYHLCRHPLRRHQLLDQVHHHQTHRLPRLYEQRFTQQRLNSRNNPRLSYRCLLRSPRPHPPSNNSSFGPSQMADSCTRWLAIRRILTMPYIEQTHSKMRGKCVHVSEPFRLHVVLSCYPLLRATRTSCDLRHNVRSFASMTRLTSHIRFES